MLSEYFEKNNVFKKCCAFACFVCLSSTLSLISKIYFQFTSIWKNSFFFNKKTLPVFLKAAFLCLARCMVFSLGWDILLLKKLDKLSLSCKVDVGKKRSWRIETIKDKRTFLNFHLSIFRQKWSFGYVACENTRFNHTCPFSTGGLKDIDLMLVWQTLISLMSHFWQVINCVHECNTIFVSSHLILSWLMWLPVETQMHCHIHPTYSFICLVGV